MDSKLSTEHLGRVIEQILEAREENIKVKVGIISKEKEGECGELEEKIP